MIIMRKAIGFLTANAIALASLAIAGMSLYLTITSQRDDRAHKELLIKPWLLVTAHTADYSVALVNDGLGPALIKDVVYYIDGQCVYLESADHKQFLAENYQRVVRRIGEGFVDLIDVKLLDGKFQSQPEIEGNAPTRNEILGVDKQIVLYRMGSEFAKEFHLRLWSLGADAQRSFNDSFQKHVLAIPLLIRYCSMSEGFCDIVTPKIPCQFQK